MCDDRRHYASEVLCVGNRYRTVMLPCCNGLCPCSLPRCMRRMVDALNKGLTLEVQSTLTKRLMDRLQQEGRGGGGAGGGGGGQQQQQGGRRAPGQQGGGAGTDAGASLQEQLKRISVRAGKPVCQ